MYSRRSLGAAPRAAAVSGELRGRLREGLQPGGGTYRDPRGLYGDHIRGILGVLWGLY